MRHDDLGLAQLTGFSAPPTDSTRAERERARCTVARHARSRLDYEMLLEVLGLIATR